MKMKLISSEIQKVIDEVSGFYDDPKRARDIMVIKLSKFDAPAIWRFLMAERELHKKRAQNKIVPKIYLLEIALDTSSASKPIPPGSDAPKHQAQMHYNGGGRY